MERSDRAAEIVELEALVDMVEAADASICTRLGLRLDRLGTAVLATASRLPSTLINRCIGLGLDEPAAPDQVDAIVDRFAAEGIDRYYVHLVPDARPPGVADWLTGRGLTPGRSWVKFTRDLEPPPERRTDLIVSPAEPADGGSFGRIVANGFGIPESGVELLASVVGRSRWHVYLCRDVEGNPAGTGAMFVSDGVAWLSFAATLPSHRKLGAQGALLSRRIRDAIDLGAHTIVTETGEAVANDPQHSYRNIERFGFRRAYARQNWVPAE